MKVNPDALQARGVRLDDVLKAARDATTPAAAGYVDTPTQRFAVARVVRDDEKEALGEVVVVGRTPGTSVRLSDVASIEEGHPVPIGDAIIDDVRASFSSSRSNLGATRSTSLGRSRPR